MDVNTLIARAQSGLGKHTKYESPGVTPPLTAVTWPASGAKNDCSGYMAWCLRISRAVDHPRYKQVNGGWFETTAIHKDVANSWGFFDQLATPKIGAFVVYPDKGGHDGHIGVITGVIAGKKGVAGIKSIIHCSLGGWKNHGDAIRETPPDPFTARSDSLIGWYTGVE